MTWFLQFTVRGRENEKGNQMKVGQAGRQIWAIPGVVADERAATILKQVLRRREFFF